MGEYVLNNERLANYQALVENGIGWNIPYAKGTFEVINGKRVFAQEKAKRLYADFMSKDISYITIEGGKRGGKDVYGLYCWACYLMVCPDTLHLATGQTINHAISTILDAEGFGIRYLLPHGEKVDVDNQTIYRFRDFYGKVKTIKFYAGAETNDRERFRGLSFGSHYANEAIKQHINTIIEGRDRTMASKWRKVIHTQNPLAGSFGYYEDYEEPLIATDSDLVKINQEKEYYKEHLSKTKKDLTKAKQDTIKVVQKAYIEKFKLPNELALKQDETIYQNYMFSLAQAFRKVENEYYSKHKLNPESYNFVEYYTNPNGVKNGKKFRYYHFNFYDNLAMTDKQRQDIIDASDTTSVSFKRDVIGVRASADNAIWDTLTMDNVLECEVPQISKGDRYLVVDYGMKNDFVVIDCDIDSDNTCYIWTEKRVSGRGLQQKFGENFVPPTNAMYADMIKEMISNRNNGNYFCVIIDPSATGLINELIVNGVIYKKAKNDVGTKPKDRPDKRVDKSLKGIWLVRDGFAKKKIFIHSSCVEGLKECYGYALDEKKLLVGIEEPVKVADHFPDCVRYLVNTIIKKQSSWS
jgi:hypothetical protein